jgi:uncharacterized protein YwbE
MLRHTPYSESETWPLTLVIDIVIKIDEKKNKQFSKTVVHVLEKSVAHILRRVGNK